MRLLYGLDATAAGSEGAVQQLTKNIGVAASALVKKAADKHSATAAEAKQGVEGLLSTANLRLPQRQAPLLGALLDSSAAKSDLVQAQSWAATLRCVTAMEGALGPVLDLGRRAPAPRSRTDPHGHKP